MFLLETSSSPYCSGQYLHLLIFAKFTVKHLRQSIFLNKVADLWLATLLKKRLWFRCFPVNFEKFPKTPFLQNTSGGRLLFCGKFFQYSLKKLRYCVLCIINVWSLLCSIWVRKVCIFHLFL